MIQAQLPPAEANRYRYEVHLEMPATGPQRPQRNYLGMVQSLELSCQEILTNHRRNIVYFTQSYLRKTHNHQSPFSHNQPAQQQPQTGNQTQTKMDIKYAIKIMRPS